MSIMGIRMREEVGVIFVDKRNVGVSNRLKNPLILMVN